MTWVMGWGSALLLAERLATIAGMRAGRYRPQLRESTAQLGALRVK